MFPQFANVWNEALLNAIPEDEISPQEYLESIKVVQLLLDCGATNYNDTLNMACNNGHIEIANILIEREGEHVDLNGVLAYITDSLQNISGYAGHGYKKMRRLFRKMAKFLREKGARV
jgi:hypothetical protein